MQAEHKSMGRKRSAVEMPTRDGTWIGDKMYTTYNTLILTRNHIFILLDSPLQPIAWWIKENRASR